MATTGPSRNAVRDAPRSSHNIQLVNTEKDTAFSSSQWSDGMEVTPTHGTASGTEYARAVRPTGRVLRPSSDGVPLRKELDYHQHQHTMVLPGQAILF